MVWVSWVVSGVVVGELVAGISVVLGVMSGVSVTEGRVVAVS